MASRPSRTKRATSTGRVRRSASGKARSGGATAPERIKRATVTSRRVGRVDRQWLPRLVDGRGVVEYTAPKRSVGRIVESGPQRAPEGPSGALVCTRSPSMGCR